MTKNRSTATRFLALGFGLALGVGAITAASCTPDPEPTPTTPTIAPTPTDTIEEDDPRWDCRTMGNMLCGVQVQGVWYILDFATGTFAPRG